MAGNSLASCSNFENYTCRCEFTGQTQTRYVIAVSNLDPVDDAVYNLTISSPSDVDFQYTDMYDWTIDDEYAMSFFSVKKCLGKLYVPLSVRKDSRN